MRWCSFSLPFLMACAPASTLPAGPPKSSDRLVAREVAFDVPHPREAFVRAFLAAPLERFIRGTSAVPGVDHTEPLTERRYPEVGSVRRVHLRDGTSADEEVLVQNEETLRYLVSSYTAEVARPIAYGIGEFSFTARGDVTHVVWRYSFKLRDDRFPGSLGGLGRWLFRTTFLDSDYASFMNDIVWEIQDFARKDVAP